MMKLHWLIGLILAATMPLAQAEFSGKWSQQMALDAAQDSRVLLLDVRSEREFATGRVPGAKNIPFDQLDSRLEELSAYGAKTIVLYCQSGRRASIAESFLSKKGFTNLYHLSGDMQAWRSAGLAQESDEK